MRRKRLVLAALLLVLPALAVTALMIQKQHLSGEFEFGYRQGICPFCGAQFREYSGVIFGMELNQHTQHLTFEMNCIDVRACNNHKLISFGECRKILSVTRFWYQHYDWGIAPHGNFFSLTPALEEALCSLAKTNRAMCALAIHRVAHFRLNVPNTVTEIYPSLYSTNVAQLAGELTKDVLNRPEPGNRFEKAWLEGIPTTK
jgi:hypothetical protein